MLCSILLSSRATGAAVQQHEPFPSSPPTPRMEQGTFVLSSFYLQYHLPGDSDRAFQIPVQVPPSVSEAVLLSSLTKVSHLVDMRNICLTELVQAPMFSTRQYLSCQRHCQANRFPPEYRKESGS